METVSCTQLQSTSRRRNEVFNRIIGYMSGRIVEEAFTCANRLLASLPHKTLKKNRVFVAFGGGKDSSYMVAFVRFVQLLIFRDYHDTFQLRIATNRHAGMPTAVMANIHQIYQALDCYHDPDIELLLIDSHQVRVFDVTTLLPEAVVTRNRLDILMTGHRCLGEARPTFCNACNLSMINSFGMAASYGDGVDVLVTGDSDKELRAYSAWIRRVAAKFGLPKRQYEQGLRSFLQTMDEVSLHYFQDIYGNDAPEALQQRRIKSDDIQRNPLFFSIYRDTDYEVENHWKLLTDFLGFQFDDIAFSFTETDCTNPALMAHLRGLRAEHLYHRSYAEGINEYVQFATELMRKKAFPDRLIEVMKKRYATNEAVQTMRAKIDDYVYESLDLSEEQLVCMLYSPFVQGAQNLRYYLEREKPELSHEYDAIGRVLASHLPPGPAEQALVERLFALTHLDIEKLRTLYTQPVSLHQEGTSHTPIAVILSRDPHKAVITTQQANGESISEMISGR